MIVPVYLLLIVYLFQKYWQIFCNYSIFKAAGIYFQKLKLLSSRLIESLLFMGGNLHIQYYDAKFCSWLSRDI